MRARLRTRIGQVRPSIIVSEDIVGELVAAANRAWTSWSRFAALGDRSGWAVSWQSFATRDDSVVPHCEERAAQQQEPLDGFEFSRQRHECIERALALLALPDCW